MATVSVSGSKPLPETQPAANNPGSEIASKPQVIYRCKRCRRIVASEENIISHEQGKGEQCFKWNKKSVDSCKNEEPPECSSIFVEPMKWMQTVQEGYVGEKLQCMGCKARLGSFNWAGMQCNCGTWINPAFLLHKSKLDECHVQDPHVSTVLNKTNFNNICKREKSSRKFKLLKKGSCHFEPLFMTRLHYCSFLLGHG